MKHNCPTVRGQKVRNYLGGMGGDKGGVCVLWVATGHRTWEKYNTVLYKCEKGNVY